ncbi:MAG TPA: hypothetical protein VF812_14070 [Ktedonobacterales bacterium]
MKATMLALVERSTGVLLAVNIFPRVRHDRVVCDAFGVFTA